MTLDNPTQPRNPATIAAYDAASRIELSLEEQGFTGVLHMIAGFKRLEEVAQGNQWMYVREARRQGITWDVIAAALGVTRSAVIQRYKDRI